MAYTPSTPSSGVTAPLVLVADPHSSHRRAEQNAGCDLPDFRDDLTGKIALIQVNISLNLFRVLYPLIPGNCPIARWLRFLCQGSQCGVLRSYRSSNLQQRSWRDCRDSQ